MHALYSFTTIGLHGKCFICSLIGQQLSCYPSFLFYCACLHPGSNTYFFEF
uniref:Uncharacterized protein n=1 Tax=Rhizophora mucronata TaxID=61149 RepID=A0A2P2QJ11_RHIMU